MAIHRFGRPHLRLPGYNYAGEGTYFLTLCTTGRECLFGDVANDEMVLNDFGRLIEAEWQRSGEIRQELRLGEFIIMPNHLHAIVHFSVHTAVSRSLVDATGCLPLRLSDHRTSPRRPRSLAAFMAGFKATTTRRLNELRGTPGRKLWQENFFEHVIRTEKSRIAITNYILKNPVRWAIDQENPARQQRKS